MSALSQNPTLASSTEMEHSSLTKSWDRPEPVVAPGDLDPDLAHGAPPTGKLFPKPR